MVDQNPVITPADRGTQMLPGAKAGALGFTGANIAKQLLAKKFKGYGHLATSSLASAAFGGLVGGIGGTFFPKTKQASVQLNTGDYKMNDYHNLALEAMEKKAGIASGVKGFIKDLRGKENLRYTRRADLARKVRNRYVARSLDTDYIHNKVKGYTGNNPLGEVSKVVSAIDRKIGKFQSTADRFERLAEVAKKRTARARKYTALGTLGAATGLTAGIAANTYERNQKTASIPSQLLRVAKKYPARVATIGAGLAVGAAANYTDKGRQLAETNPHINKLRQAAAKTISYDLMSGVSRLGGTMAKRNGYRGLGYIANAIGGATSGMSTLNATKGLYHGYKAIKHQPEKTAGVLTTAKRLGNVFLGRNITKAQNQLETARKFSQDVYPRMINKAWDNGNKTRNFQGINKMVARGEKWNNLYARSAKNLDTQRALTRNVRIGAGGLAAAGAWEGYKRSQTPEKVAGIRSTAKKAWNLISGKTLNKAWKARERTSDWDAKYHNMQWDQAFDILGAKTMSGSRKGQQRYDAMTARRDKWRDLANKANKRYQKVRDAQDLARLGVTAAGTGAAGAIAYSVKHKHGK